MENELIPKFKKKDKVRINLNNIHSDYILKEVQARIEKNGGNVWIIKEVIPWGKNGCWYMTTEDSFETAWRERYLLTLSENKYKIRGL